MLRADRQVGHSAFLVLTAFPAMYLAVATVRNAIRQLFGKGEAFAHSSEQEQHTLKTRRTR